MRVIVEAVSGPGKGRVFTLKPGVVVVVGRTEWSDVCISSDQQMSARHFAIESGSSGLKLVDQGSTNGTQVDGEFVKEAPLYDGSQVMAGTTTFSVRVEQATAAPSSNEGGSPIMGDSPSPTPGMAPTGGNSPFGSEDPYAPQGYGNSPFGGNAPSGAAPSSPFGGSPIMPPDQVASAGPVMEEGPTSVEPAANDANFGQPSAANSGDAGFNSPIIMDDAGPSSGTPSSPDLPPMPPEQGTDPGQVVSTPIEYAPSGGSPISQPPESSGGESTPISATPIDAMPASDPSQVTPVDVASAPQAQAPASQPPASQAPASQPPASQPPASQPPASQPSSQPSSDFISVPIGEAPSEREAAVLDTARNVRAASPEVLQYSVHPCKCPSIKCLRSNYGGAEVEFFPSSIMGLLKRHLPLVTIIHFQKGNLEFPAELTEATPLLHWLPEETAKNFGPVMVPPTQQLDRFATVDQMWDADGTLCFYARDIHGAMRHLVELVKYNLSGPNDQEGIFGYCWPSVLANLLQNQDAEMVNVIFANLIDCVLMEVPGEPGNWQMFGTDAHISLLNQTGFREIPLPEEPQEQAEG